MAIITGLAAGYEVAKSNLTTKIEKAMIGVIGISKDCLDCLEINSPINPPWFQWHLFDIDRISVFNKISPKKIEDWIQGAINKKFSPVLLLANSDANHIWRKLSSSVEVNILPKVNDSRFDSIFHDMHNRLYTPDKFLARLWTNWKCLGILPPEGVTKEYTIDVWEAYGKGLYEWFKASQIERHPTAARSLIFSRQKPVKIETAEIDERTKEREGDDRITFSPIDLPFARFRLEKKGDQDQLSVVLGPMKNQELDAPSPELINFLRHKSPSERIREIIKTLLSYDPLELVPIFGAQNPIDGEEPIDLGKQNGIQARIDWQGDTPKATLFEISLIIDEERLIDYLPTFDKQNESLTLSVLTQNQAGGTSREFAFNLILSPQKKVVYFDGESESPDSQVGEYYQEAGDLIIYLKLPLSKGTISNQGVVNSLQLTLSFKSSSRSVTFPFGY